MSVCICRELDVVENMYYSQCVDTWAPAGIFPEGGKTALTNKNDLFFGAPTARTEFFVIVRHFRLNLRVFDASTEGASEHFWVFSTGAAYDVIIFEFQGGGATAPGCPPPSGRLCVDIVL